MATMYIQQYTDKLQSEINKMMARKNDVEDAFDKCVTFLKDNTDEDLCDDDDIVIITKRTIAGLENDIKNNASDIKNIQNSEKTLKSINNHIDSTVIDALEKKITEIANTNQKISKIIEEINPYVQNLLDIEVDCSCSGKNSRYPCSICGGKQVTTLSKLLYPSGSNNAASQAKQQQTPPLTENKYSGNTEGSTNNSNDIKYTISRR